MIDAGKFDLLTLDASSDPEDHAGPVGLAGSETEFIRRIYPPVTGRVLVMDDDKLILEVASLVLESIGLEVVTAENGEEAVRYFHSALTSGKPFDLVILDLIIPNGQGGEETFHQIRLADPGVKVIVSSGHLTSLPIARGDQNGFDDTLPKPYRSADLLQMAFLHLPRK
ncbi:MAG: response regulator [Verrucomicrobiota bacterium]